MDLSNVTWVKSSLSGDNGGDCVEVARLGNATGRPGLVAVRDSKDPGGPALLFTPAEWDSFIGRVRTDGLGLG
ncbi:DUF397 domain-containing protein [Streptosporangium sp. DT93]|uniref:DUF397 domain-containing protein n=1 Tax=Streptosporangium sp. DT93 TaxID=3393428 RepID=UPI003CEC4873